MSEEYGPNFVTLTDEEGNDIELEYIDALEHNGTTYMAFFPVVEEGEEENEDEYGLIILKGCLYLNLLGQLIININATKPVIIQLFDIGCRQFAASSYHRPPH